MALRLAYSRDTLPVGTTVKYSLAALRPAWDWYLSRGNYEEKTRAKESHARIAARRGTIIAVNHTAPTGVPITSYTIRWAMQDTHGPYTSETAPHLVTLAAGDDEQPQEARDHATL